MNWTIEERNNAYYTGRNSVWNGDKRPCPFKDEVLALNWKQGRRDAQAEERLDRDTEWDSDEVY